MKINGETFEEFHARISANRVAAIAACEDPVKRAELVMWHERFEAQYRAAWQLSLAHKESVQREEKLREDGDWEEYQEPEYQRSDREEHCTYHVDSKGRAW